MFAKGIELVCFIHNNTTNFVCEKQNYKRAKNKTGNKKILS
jgi:hypothetical protein